MRMLCYEMHLQRCVHIISISNIKSLSLSLLRLRWWCTFPRWYPRPTKGVSMLLDVCSLALCLQVSRQESWDQTTCLGRRRTSTSSPFRGEVMMSGSGAFMWRLAWCCHWKYLIISSSWYPLNGSDRMRRIHRQIYHQIVYSSTIALRSSLGQYVRGRGYTRLSVA